MKKIIISILAAVFITLVIPLAVVGLVPQRDNAASTEPQHTEGDTLTQNSGGRHLLPAAV